MAKNMVVRNSYTFGMFDPRKRRPYEIWSIVDVTEDCPGASESNRCVFCYAYTEQLGWTVQITQPYTGPKHMGKFRHFFPVEDLENKLRDVLLSSAFRNCARRLGLSQSELSDLIMAHRPVVPTKIQSLSRRYRIYQTLQGSE